MGCAHQIITADETVGAATTEKMNIHLSRHAKRQMKWREVDEDEIRNTISDPEKIEDSIKGRKNAFKHIGDKWLKVTFKEESNKIVIVTVVDKNK